MEKSNLNYAADNYSKLQGQKLIRSTGLLKVWKGIEHILRSSEVSSHVKILFKLQSQDTYWIVISCNRLFYFQIPIRPVVPHLLSTQCPDWITCVSICEIFNREPQMSFSW